MLHKAYVCGRSVRSALMKSNARARKEKKEINESTFHTVLPIIYLLQANRLSATPT